MAPQRACLLLAVLLLAGGAAATGEPDDGAAAPAPAGIRELPQPDEELVKRQNPHQAVLDYAERCGRRQPQRALCRAAAPAQTGRLAPRRAAASPPTPLPSPACLLRLLPQ